MSVFASREIRCGTCGRLSTHDLASSINPARSPHHYAAVKSGTFHRFPCPNCTARIQVETRLSWIDFKRKHFFDVWPADAVSEWAEAEGEISTAFERYMRGDRSSAAARELAPGFLVRTLFGLSALREKLVCLEAGLDDRALALLVLLTMRDTPGLLDRPGRVPRLIEAGDPLVFTVADDQVLEIDHGRYDEVAGLIATDPGLVRQVGGGAWVDARRALTEPR